VLLADAGRVDEAVAHCQRATEYDPTSSQAWNNLGFLLLVAERPTEALAASAKAVELDSTNALFRNNLALAQAAAGRHEAAYQTYQSTLPRAVAAYNVGAALERFDDPDHALVYYERAIDFDPTHADAVAALARLNDARPAGDSDTPPPGDTP
jgi:Flp pilus assembly protein TadD